MQASSSAPQPRTQGTMPPNAMTVDVEDYYHVSAFAGAIKRDSWNSLPSRVQDNTLRIIDLFGAAGIRATFFVLGWVARQSPGTIRAITSAGHELASHGMAHRRVGEQGPKAFREDVALAKNMLEQAGGVSVAGYRAPSFSIDQASWWAFDILEESGYRYSSSLHPIRHDHYGMPDAPRFPFMPSPGARILEIPVGTFELFGTRLSCAGGGYFRLMPYRWTASAIRNVNRREGKPVTFYFHPWEIDPEQPRIRNVAALARFRHYVNLGAMEGKLLRLLSDFSWSRMDAVYASEIEGAGEGSRSYWGPPVSLDQPAQHR